jgi:Cys-tRNA(Pro)/Cys-tRNA(Cys) deacylase
METQGKKIKTNAIRILETAGIEHDIRSYEVQDDVIDAVSVAHKIGASEEEVFKTLVARGDKTGLVVFVIPGNAELQLKKAALASGNKNVELIAVRELPVLTGYIRGGCSPVGMKKLLPTHIDETAQLFDRIFVSAGVRGMQIHIAPDDLVRVIQARYSDLI